MTRRKEVTISDIAQAAGVSSSCVSMILNERSLPRFSDATIAAVRDAARRLSYQKRARSRHTRPIVIICPSVMNPYYATMIQGIEQAARLRELYTLCVATYWDPRVEEETLLSLDGMGACGVLFCMIPQCTTLVEEVSRRLPTIAIGDRVNDFQFQTVNINNFHSGMLLGDHLIALGHRRVAYVSTTLGKDHSARMRRLAGLDTALREHCADGAVTVLEQKIAIRDELSSPDIEHQTGVQLTQRCLREAPDTTAIVAINDMVAYGVLDALAETGLRVPQDMSVCGFDNIYPSRFRRMALTTVDHAIYERGQSALQLLLSRMDLDGSGSQNVISRMEYESRLIVRRTTGAPRAAALALTL